MAMQTAFDLEQEHKINVLLCAGHQLGCFGKKCVVLYFCCCVCFLLASLPNMSTLRVSLQRHCMGHERKFGSFELEKVQPAQTWGD